MKTLKIVKSKTKLGLSACKTNIWNLQRRYRRQTTNRVARISTTYGLLRA